MLNQPEGKLDPLGAIPLTASSIRALMVRHQLEPRRKVFGICRELLFSRATSDSSNFRMSRKTPRTMG